jgi:predicted SAM-dependent methyltransferase
MPTLELGCGNLPQPEYDLHLDLHPGPCIEIVSDARTIPLPDNHIDVIFNQHLIEHFDREEVKVALKEWLRVLKPHGVLKILCPNLLHLMTLYFHAPQMKRDVIRWMYGGQDYPENYHKNIYDFPLLYEDLWNAGFRDIKLMDGHAIADFGLWVQCVKPSIIIPI